MLTIGSPAPDVSFGSSDGNVSLAGLYRDGTIVLAFLRHFG
jgi:hypothetical protein